MLAMTGSWSCQARRSESSPMWATGAFPAVTTISAGSSETIPSPSFQQAAMSPPDWSAQAAGLVASLLAAVLRGCYGLAHVEIGSESARSGVQDRRPMSGSRLTLFCFGLCGPTRGGDLAQRGGLRAPAQPQPLHRPSGYSSFRFR